MHRRIEIKFSSTDEKERKTLREVNREKNEKKTQLEKKMTAVQNDANAHEQDMLKNQKTLHVQDMKQLKKKLSIEK
jgi:hypothetical protein